MCWPRHKRVACRRLHDVPQPVHVQQRIRRAGPEARGLEGNVHARVENPAPGRAVGSGRPGLPAVISQPPAGARRDVQPAEKCRRRQQLLERVGARGGIVGVGAVRAEEQRIVGLGVALAVIAGGAFALVINRRVEHLLPPAGELHLRQPLDLVEEVVDLRRRQRV